MQKLLLLVLATLFLAPTGAWALDVTASEASLTFHISHPAKKYDGILLAGGGTFVGHFDPADISKTGCDVEIRVDQFNSSNTRRDSHMIEVLEGLIFPTITWRVEGLTGVTGPLKPGKYLATASGPLTVHGVSQELSIPIAMTVEPDGKIDVSADFTIELEAFGLDRPTLVFVPIENVVPIKVRAVFPAGAGVLSAE